MSDGITVSGKAYDRAYEHHLRSWHEDREHENGNYDCICSQCNEVFTGHKRRVICRICAKPTTHKPDKE